jgi:hypothetical protein
MTNEGGSVKFKDSEYLWSNGNWYNSQTNLMVPLVVAHELDSNFKPVKKYPVGKRSRIKWEPFQEWRRFTFSGGLPGSGRRR